MHLSTKVIWSARGCEPGITACHCLGCHLQLTGVLDLYSLSGVIVALEWWTHAGCSCSIQGIDQCSDTVCRLQRCSRNSQDLVKFRRIAMKQLQYLMLWMNAGRGYRTDVDLVVKEKCYFKRNVNACQFPVSNCNSDISCFHLADLRFGICGTWSCSALFGRALLAAAP